ncbi:amino acid adenylation domain-containing protein [Streptomyces sp. NPDC002676]
MPAGTPHPSPDSPETLAEEFLRIAERFPARIALVDGNTTLTYAELDRAANQRAHVFASQGIGVNDHIGLLVDRSAQSVVNILALLKAGAAYVPLDPDYPAERLRYITEDHGLKVVVGDPLRAQDCGLDHVTVIGPDLALSGIDGRPPAAASTARVKDPVYTIYTSGSTGRPKGVTISNANVLALMRSTLPLFEFTPQDRWALFHSLSFDFSVWELWGALLTGATAVCVPQLQAQSADDFLDLLIRERITVLNQVPSAFRALTRVHEGAGAPETSLRYVIFGGESVDLDVASGFVSRISGPRPVMVNMYGITEATVHSTVKVLTDEDYRRPVASPIGTALPHVGISLRNGRLEEVADGEPGEIFISGDSVALGYVDRLALTAERFPTLQTPTGPARFYRTGDLGRRLGNGELEYLGRNDHQVKVRGFRIEPGEIESVLRRHDLVSDVAVAPDARGSALVAAVVAESDSIDERTLARKLRLHAASLLPKHMVPSRYAIVPRLPLTASGKLDRRALAALSGPAQ